MRVFLRLAHVFLYDSVCACWRVQGRGLKCFLGRETSGTFGIIVSSIWNSQWGKVFPFFGYLRAVHIVSFYQRRVGILHLWGKNLFEINITDWYSLLTVYYKRYTIHILQAFKANMLKIFALRWQEFCFPRNKYSFIFLLIKLKSTDVEYFFTFA